MAIAIPPWVVGRQASIRTGANGSCGDGKRQYFSYTDRGELYRTWGETTYPVEYAYDACGRRTLFPAICALSPAERF